MDTSKAEDRSAVGTKGKATRRVLLRAAEQIIIEEGIHALTIRQIGIVSGVAATLVTYHFGTISKLLQELVKVNLDPMLEAWEPLKAHQFDNLRDALEAWMEPLMMPSAYVEDGRALIVMDEIASHGDTEIRDMVLVPMLELSAMVQTILSPFVPHLEPRVLRARVRFLSASTLGPPPRSYSLPPEGDLPNLDSKQYWLDFAIAALQN